MSPEQIFSAARQASPRQASTKQVSLDAEGYFFNGNQYLANHQYSEAILEYKQALVLNPYYKEAYLNLGRAYQSKELFKEAVSSYQKAIALDKNYVEAYINLGVCYEKQNLLNKAQTALKKAIELDPVHPEAHFNLANTFYKKEELKDSINEYIKTLKIDPTHFQAYINLGSIYFKDLKDNKKAIDYFEQAKKIKPKDEISYIKLGELYFKEELFDKAISEYKKAINLNPKNATSLSQLGLLYLTIGRHKDALPIAEKLVNIIPTNPLAHYTLGIIYEKSGRFEEALNEFGTVLSLDPEDEPASFKQERIVLELAPAKVSSIWRKQGSEKYSINAQNHLKEGLLSLAAYEFKRSLELDPQNPKTRLSLAKLYELLGRKQLAIWELMKVVELDPNNLEARDRLEKLYFENEVSLTRKEKITQIPASEITLIVCGTAGDYLHYGIEDVIVRMLISLLKQFPQVTVINEVLILNDEKDVVAVGQNLGAKLALMLKVNENEEMVEIIAELIDLNTVKKVLTAHLPIKGKDKLIKAASFLAEKVISAVPIQGVIMKLTNNEVIINLGKTHGLKPDQILEVWKRGEEPKSIGKIKILEVAPEISKAIIITPMTLRFVEINDIVKLPSK
ncbi:MAG: tetratricopeptide repeat protein [bacterium]|nr:tetratricopeptide repeat protein [bacterium]